METVYLQHCDPYLQNHVQVCYVEKKWMRVISHLSFLISLRNEQAFCVSVLWYHQSIWYHFLKCQTVV